MKQAIFLAIVLACQVFGATEWTTITSPNFRLITTAGSGEGKRIITYFEQVQDFFQRTRPITIKNRLPVTIVLFRNMKEFKPYSPSENAVAYYTGDHSHDYIVMSGATDDDRPVAVHEYMHLLVNRVELNLPPWLNEGVAEAYSTLRPYAGKIAVGMVPRGRAITLSMDKWLPLPRLLEVRHEDPEYNKSAHSGAFYAQSWMLVHMLMLGEGYAKDFGKFIAAISGGAKSDAALQSVYGKDVATVSRDLQAYYRSDSLKAALFNTKLEKISGVEAGETDNLEVELHLARVLATGARKDEAATRLAKMAKENPGRWEVHEAIGSLAARRGDMKTAGEAYRRAVELKPNEWSVYWDYARLAQQDSSQREPVLAALQKTIELNEANLDARMALGEQFLFMNRHKEALDALKTVKSVPPERAARYFVAQAHANIGLNQIQEARLAGLSAKKYATKERDTEEVSRLFDYLDRRRTAEEQQKQWEKANRNATVSLRELPAAASSSPGAPAAPVRELQITTAPEILSRVEGSLKQVDCMVTQARLRIDAGGKLVSLLIVDPGAITIRNEPGSSMNLTCGPQSKAPKVIVEYRDAVDAKTGTTGEVRTVEFLK